MNTNYRQELMEEGFVCFQIQNELTEVNEKEIESLKKAFEEMPKDVYADSKGRFRYFSRGVIMPWNNHFEWLPSIISESGEEEAEYFQGEFNPEYMGACRSFPAIPEAIRQTNLLKQIIQYDFLQTEWDKREEIMPIHVGIHFVRLEVKDPKMEAVSSPNCLHRDGEPFTFVHLIDRKGVIGGENVIARVQDIHLLPKKVPACHIKAEFVLNTPLSSYGVNDDLVSHYVSSVQLAEGFKEGHRDVILIDFQPTIVKPL